MQTSNSVATKRRNFFDIHNDAIIAARDIKQRYLVLFEILLEVESKQIYHQFEVPSLYIYCVELLDLSSSIANDFVNVVRKSLEIPELAASIRSQKVTISKARKICPVITPTDNKVWIELAEACSCRIIEKAVAPAKPKTSVIESMKYISDETLEFKLAVSEDWRVLLEKTKDLLSQKHKRAVSSEEALMTLMKDYTAKNDPVEKAKRALAKSEAKPQASKNLANCSEERSRYRPASVEHLVTLRDQNQCSYINRLGRRCRSKRRLHKHHINEFAKGGEHSLENLETLCSGHHKIRHLNASSIRHVTN